MFVSLKTCVKECRDQHGKKRQERIEQRTKERGQMVLDQYFAVFKKVSLQL